MVKEICFGIAGYDQDFRDKVREAGIRCSKQSSHMQPK